MQKLEYDSSAFVVVYLSILIARTVAAYVHPLAKPRKHAATPAQFRDQTFERSFLLTAWFSFSFQLSSSHGIDALAYCQIHISSTLDH